ncbi:MAG: arylsulfatase A-like enzyme [Myxococcota bacterium]|jgi:arylsulfatase A-like enzyme
MLWCLIGMAGAAPVLTLGPAPAPGERLEVRVEGVTPGAMAYLFGSPSGPGETCPVVGCMGLAAPLIRVAARVADADGVARVRVPVPADMSPGATLWMQAAVTGPFEASAVVPFTVAEHGGPVPHVVPERPWSGEPIICSTEGAESVAWTVDGVDWAGPVDTHAIAGDRIPEGQLEVGQRWECTATGPLGSGASAVEVGEPLGGNVLVLLADDLGVERLAAFGGVDPIPTPTLDALAAEGVVFTRATVHATCSPTRAALLTGRHARRTGVGVRIGTLFDAWELPLEERLVPEVLTESPLDYTSVALGKWHLASNGSASAWEHPLLQGFAHHRGAFGNLQFGHEPPDAPLDYYHWSKLIDGVPGYSDVYATTDTVDDALAQLDALPEPWFLYVAFNAPHDPFHFPPLRLIETPIGLDATDAEKWAAAVEALDTELGRLLDGMAPDVRDRTTVVFMGDNGWPEEAVTDPFDPLRAKTTLYEGGVHVPLIVSGPAVASPGSMSDALVSDVDLLPTVAELAGVRVPRADGLPVASPWPELALDGESWVGLLDDPSAPAQRSHVYLERFSPNGEEADWDMDETGIRDARWKLIRYTAGVEELFDLTATPLVDGDDLLLAPLSDDAADAWTRLSAALDAARAAVGAD